LTKVHKSIFLPRFRPPPSYLSRKKKLEICVGGGIMYSNNNHRILLLSLKKFQHDSNFVITQLFSMIRAVATSSFKACCARRLILLLDNCWRENKNQIVFAFGGWLVGIEWFEEVEYCFMIVGHTGYKIDTIFSPLQDALALDPATVTIVDIALRALSNVENPMEVVVIDSVFDWLTFFYDSMPGLGNHSKCHGFLVSRTSEGKIIIRGKRYSGLSPKWGPPALLLNSTPQGFPQELKTSIDPISPQVLSTLKKVLKKETHLSADEKKWFADVIATKTTCVEVGNRYEDGKIGVES
jgi:hypothetical protein